MNQSHRCLIPIAMFYMTIKIATILLIYKFVTIGPVSIPASSIIISIWFLTGDTIAELYGYDVSKKIIWTALVCQFIFAFFCAASTSHLLSPINLAYPSDYDHILSNLPLVAVASFIAILGGARINAYAVSKWKVLLSGRLFWLRSLGASIIGEIVFIIIAITIEYIGLIPLQSILKIMVTSFLLKLIINPILIIPFSIVTTIITKIEGVDVSHDYLMINPSKSQCSAMKSNDFITP